MRFTVRSIRRSTVELSFSHLEYDLSAFAELILFAGLHQSVVRSLADVNAIR